MAAFLHIGRPEILGIQAEYGALPRVLGAQQHTVAVTQSAVAGYSLIPAGGVRAWMVGMPVPSLNPCVGSGGGFGGRFCSFGRGWADDAAGWEIYGVSVRTFAWIGRGSTLGLLLRGFRCQIGWGSLNYPLGVYGKSGLSGPVGIKTGKSAAKPMGCVGQTGASSSVSMMMTRRSAGSSTRRTTIHTQMTTRSSRSTIGTAPRGGTRTDDPGRIKHRHGRNWPPVVIRVPARSSCAVATRNVPCGGTWGAGGRNAREINGVSSTVSAVGAQAPPFFPPTRLCPIPTKSHLPTAPHL